MLICKDLTIAGTVGGGRLEAETILAAKALFDTGGSAVLKFNLTGKDAAETEMICGGYGEILMVFMDPKNESDRTLVDHFLRCDRARKKGWLVTKLHKDGSCQQRLFEEEDQFDSNAEETLETQVFVEKIFERCELYLFGAGHVAQKVAPIAESVGFSTIVIDDRTDFANLNRFPNSKILVVPSLEGPLPELPINKDSYIAIMTRGHLHDKAILSQVLNRPAAYIGMIGSKNKRDLLYKHLIENEQYQLSDFDKVYCPIGLNILAETPEEIAISIVAELVRVRAMGYGKA